MLLCLDGSITIVLEKDKGIGTTLSNRYNLMHDHTGSGKD